LHDGRYYPREEGIQTAGVAQSAENSEGEKWQGAIHVMALNVIYPDLAICFKLCSARPNGQQIYSYDQLLFK